MIQPSRRGLILGLGAALVAAPAIVRAGSLMPIKALPMLEDGLWVVSAIHPARETINVMGHDMWGNLVNEEIEIGMAATGLKIIACPSVLYVGDVVSFKSGLPRNWTEPLHS